MTPKDRYLYYMTTRLKQLRHDETLKVSMELYINQSKYWAKGWCSDEEGALLLDIALEEKPDHIYECGTCNGYSTMWLSFAGYPITTFDVVDRPKVWNSHYMIIDNINPIPKIPDNVTSITESFQSLDCKDLNGKKMFFIDGHHKRPSVIKDRDTVLANASSGDVVTFHDLKIKAVGETYYDMVEKHAASHTEYDTNMQIGRLTLK